MEKRKQEQQGQEDEPERLSVAVDYSEWPQVEPWPDARALIEGVFGADHPLPTGEWPRLTDLHSGTKADDPPLPEDAPTFAAHLRRSVVPGKDDLEPLYPSDLSAIVACAGIEHIALVRHDGDWQATIDVSRSSGRFKLDWDPTPPSEWGDVLPHLRWDLARHRSRFLLAHEIGHALLWPITRGRRLTDFLLPSPWHDQLERFCDEFARSLLVPPAAVKRLPRTPDSIVQLHKTYDTSVTLAARAFQAAQPDCIAATMVHSDDPKRLQKPTDACFIQRWYPGQPEESYRNFPAIRWWAEGPVWDAIEHGRACFTAPTRNNSEVAVELLYLPARKQVVLVGQPA